MKNILPISIALISLLGLTACDKPLSEEEARLSEIIEKTQTTDKARTVEWYQNNDFVRNDVIKNCMDMVESKVAQVNALGGELKYDDIDKQINKNQDCLNARQANINIETELDKSRITYNEYNQRLNQQEKNANTANTVLTDEEREEAKAYMQTVMEEMDENQVARQGEKQFDELKKIAESEIKQEDTN